MTELSEGRNEIYRILDAAIDRGREAVRVIEDAVRFIADNAQMTERLKDFRHRFAAVSERVPMDLRLTCRATETDVGTSIEGAGEYQRDSLERILTANFCRLQESLRSLEEYSKLIMPEISRGFEGLRYESYVLQKAISPSAIKKPELPSSAESVLFQRRKDQLNRSRLYVLIESDFSEENFLRLLDGGADLIQFRDKSASDRILYESGKRFVSLLDEWTAKQTNQGRKANRPLLIVNDRADIALAIRADGVHIGQGEIPPEEVRRMIGSEMILGLSTSSPEEAMNAVRPEVDYLGAGPVFPSVTKSFETFPGLDYLRFLTSDPAFLAKNAVNLPIFAIGGIYVENLPSVLETGIAKIAVASAVTATSDVGEAARRLQDALNR